MSIILCHAIGKWWASWNRYKPCWSLQKFTQCYIMFTAHLFRHRNLKNSSYVEFLMLERWDPAIHLLFPCHTQWKHGHVKILRWVLVALEPACKMCPTDSEIPSISGTLLSWCYMEIWHDIWRAWYVYEVMQDNMMATFGGINYCTICMTVSFSPHPSIHSLLLHAQSAHFHYLYKSHN